MQEVMQERHLYFVQIIAVHVQVISTHTNMLFIRFQHITYLITGINSIIPIQDILRLKLFSDF